jgi:SAM-dependent methyltransferase
MTLSPTLRCPCEMRFLEGAFQYESVPQGETSFDLGGHAYRRGYERCVICDHWFGSHALDLSGLYSHDYAESTYGGAEGMGRRFAKIMALPPERSDNRQRVARVLCFSRAHWPSARASAPRLLDVGAGIGVFPAAMQEAGWHVTALEPDTRTVAHLRDVAHVQAAAANLLDLTPASFGTFDAVTFNKVLEHVEDPVALLRRASELLDPAGFIYVELPDVAAAVDGPGREEFFIEHHHVFSPGSFVLLAQGAGLSPLVIERLREPSGKYTLRGFLVRPRIAAGDRS